MRKAFTLVELVMVIAIIGILSAIAVPKLIVTRDDAQITKARTTVANVRSALSEYVQKKILKGDYSSVKNVGGGINSKIFDYFDNNVTGDRVLEYPLAQCAKATSKGCWVYNSDDTYTYRFPAGVGGSVKFVVRNNRFECADGEDEEKCKLLDR